MRIITMQRLTLDGKPVYSDAPMEKDWWCVIETKGEEMVSDDFLKHLGEYSGDCRGILWNRLVIHAGQGMGVSWGDDDMYGYIRPDEEIPEVKENFKDGEGDIWVRVD